MFSTLPHVPVTHKSIGLYYDFVEPTTVGGYGSGFDVAYSDLCKNLNAKHPGAVVVNTKLEIVPPRNKHESYNVFRYTVLGDLCVPI